MTARRFQSASGVLSASKNPSIEAIAILWYQFKEAVHAIVETSSPWVLQDFAENIRANTVSLWSIRKKDPNSPNISEISGTGLH